MKSFICKKVFPWEYTMEITSHRYLIYYRKWMIFSNVLLSIFALICVVVSTFFKIDVNSFLHTMTLINKWKFKLCNKISGELKNGDLLQCEEAFNEKKNPYENQSIVLCPSPFKIRSKKWIFLCLFANLLDSNGFYNIQWSLITIIMKLIEFFEEVT